MLNGTLPGKIKGIFVLLRPLDISNSLIGDVIIFQAWVDEAISTFPARPAEDAARMQLAEGLATSKHRHAFGDVLDSFFGACTRRTALV